MVGATKFVVYKIKLSFHNTSVMCWSEFLVIIGASALLIAIFIFMVTGFIMPVVFYSVKAWDAIYRALAWPFCALWRFIFPPKKKHHRFHYDDDDIEIRF